METITAWYNKGVKDLGLGNFLIQEVEPAIIHGGISIWGLCYLSA